MKFTLFCALVLAGCTKPNPAVCCLDQAECSEVGLDEIRTCSAGLACVEHQCEVPSCSTTGCMASAPVCNITTDACDPCTESGQCARFGDAPVCDTTSGGCVGCVEPADCSGPTPVCDSNACRACRTDTECASGACGDDGACIAESPSRQSFTWTRPVPIRERALRTHHARRSYSLSRRRRPYVVTWCSQRARTWRMLFRSNRRVRPRAPSTSTAVVRR